MKFDSVICCGCVLLLLMGAVFGGALMKGDFQAVIDVVGLMSSIATVIAVYIAWSGVSAWRDQVRATSDNELARKVMLSLNRYTRKVMYLWGYVQPLARAVEGAGEEDLGVMLPFFKDSLLNCKCEVDALSAELKVLRFECATFWGDEFGKSFDDIIGLETDCSYATYKYIRWAGYGEHKFRREVEGLAVLEVDRKLKGLGILSEKDIVDYVDRITSPLIARLKEKMIN